MTEYLDLLMFAVLIGAILLGYPVSFTLTGVAVVFAGLGWALGAFDVSLLGALGQRIFGIMTNDVLIAIPLFVFMGVVLQQSKIAEELLETMGRLFGSLRGGLGVSVILVGALLAASTGIVGATVVAMGMIALPTMLRNGYSPTLASGVVCTAGTLGQIIPPSTLLIILSDVMSNAYQQAQFRQGLFTIDTISVGQTFAAALVPGLTLVAIYVVYMLVKAWSSPEAAPALARTRLWRGRRCAPTPATFCARCSRRCCSSSPYWAPSWAAWRPPAKPPRWGPSARCCWRRRGARHRRGRSTWAAPRCWRWRS